VTGHRGLPRVRRVRYGGKAFGAVVAATLIGWTLDTAGGHLARAASNPVPSLAFATFGTDESRSYRPPVLPPDGRIEHQTG